MNAEYEEGVGRIATDGIWEVSLGPRADQLGGERVLIASNEEGTAVRSAFTSVSTKTPMLKGEECTVLSSCRRWRSRTSQA